MACSGPATRTVAPNTSEANTADSRDQEQAQGTTENKTTEPAPPKTNEPEPEEPSTDEPAAEPKADEPAAEPATEARRYRRGGGKVRRGGRAIELKKAVNGNGRRVVLESFKAPVLVLTFGASWCAPCKKELPALEKLARKYKQADVAFVAVNIDSTIDKGKTFMKQAGLRRVQAVYDPKGLNAQSYDPPTMPSVYIIKDGIVRTVHAGYKAGDERKLKKGIDKVL